MFKEVRGLFEVGLQRVYSSGRPSYQESHARDRAQTEFATSIRGLGIVYEAVEGLIDVETVQQIAKEYKRAYLTTGLL